MTSFKIFEDDKPFVFDDSIPRGSLLPVGYHTDSSLFFNIF